MANNKIEDKINDFLCGIKQRDALDFVAFLRANELLEESDDSGYAWGIKYAGGVIKIAETEKELWIWFSDVMFGTECSADDELNHTIWDSVVICPQETCPSKRHCGCEGEVSGTVFGKAFESTCYFPLGFFSPDAKALENVKKLLLLFKEKRIIKQCTK